MTDYSKNLYFDPNLESNIVVPFKISQALRFNQKGKYHTLGDRGLTAASSYQAIALESLLISSADTIVTHYIQHSVLLSPRDELAPPMAPFRLIKKEQKKDRSQRCAEGLKAGQARFPLHQVPSPPPKLKKSNLIPVLGEEAVNDLVAVEPPVNLKIKEHQCYLKATEECKLTKE